MSNQEYGISPRESSLLSERHEFLGRPISGIFTIPAGIVTTNINVLARIASEIPEIGVITTKSIGPEQRLGNREPILTQYTQGCFINAVGLTNPGAKEFAEQLERIEIPEDKFLLTSIFGRNVEEFVYVAKMLAPYSSGLEVNLSCPHSSEVGMALGQDPKLVYEIVSSIKRVVDIPVIPKLTPNVTNILGIAEAAIKGGADALCVINTVGPGYYSVDGYPVLTNQVGGISGKGILPLGLKCVREISTKFGIPIIGMGGISSADDVNAYKSVGASIFGVGSALAGLSTEELKQYFSQLNRDLREGTNEAVRLLRSVEMNFTKHQLIENRKLTSDSSLLVFDGGINIQPGQFVFAWIPNVGEKPFSVLDDNPLTLAVQKRGCFTEKLINLREKDQVYFRGPYGIPVKTEGSKRIILVGGGCGMAALYGIAKAYPRAEIFFGSKDANHLFYLEEMARLNKVNIATEDGSMGDKGLITELLARKLLSLKEEETTFFNCGPEKMIDAAIRIEREYAPLSGIFSSIDYVTKCGVGLCGSCATKDGRRLCVDGPFMTP